MTPTTLIIASLHHAWGLTTLACLQRADQVRTLPNTGSSSAGKERTSVPNEHGIRERRLHSADDYLRAPAAAAEPFIPRPPEEAPRASFSRRRVLPPPPSSSSASQVLAHTSVENGSLAQSSVNSSSVDFSRTGSDPTYSSHPALDDSVDVKSSSTWQPTPPADGEFKKPPPLKRPETTRGSSSLRRSSSVVVSNTSGETYDSANSDATADATRVADASSSAPVTTQSSPPTARILPKPPSSQSKAERVRHSDVSDNERPATTAPVSSSGFGVDDQHDSDKLSKTDIDGSQPPVPQGSSSPAPTARRTSTSERPRLTSAQLQQEQLVNDEISDILSQLTPEQEDISLLYALCDRLRDLVQGQSIRSGRFRSSALRSLFRLLDLRDSRLLVKLAQIILLVRT
jgi:hypothetical protein